MPLDVCKTTRYNRPDIIERRRSVAFSFAGVKLVFGIANQPPEDGDSLFGADGPEIGPKSLLNDLREENDQAQNADVLSRHSSLDERGCQRCPD